ncbi:hypothetical protein [Agromyces archimandritae]|uniref:Large exoprotein n=1 Tax=Agromyces archimandritae TaxID=2781962 RepID=A0A975IMY3_9MICO|nr:hypothetical protein [Agromyces archimandritae]QTX04027.1 hypothetical protein G127AT_12060 [Agromyces archimandritae]
MDVIGGGVLAAVAAALWIAYLLPSWFRRRQYLAEERNVVRLQQALRVIAETSETPETVEVEVTAREVARQQRIARERELAREAELRQAEAREAEEAAEALVAAEAAEVAAAHAVAAARAVAAPEAIAEPEEPAAPRSPAPLGAQARARVKRVRRARGTCTLAFLVGLVVLVVGLALLGTGAGVWMAVGGGVAMLAACSGLVALAGVKPAAAPAAVAPAESQPFEPIEFEAPPAEAVPWTPQPLPKPLTLSRGTIAATVMASIEEAERLKRAAADAELAQRAAALEPELPRLDEKRRAEAAAVAENAEAAEAPAPAPAADSRYARMGIVGDAQPGIDDLDAVLRRRRTAG